MVLFVLFGSMVIGKVLPLQMLEPAWQLGLIAVLINAFGFPLVGLSLPSSTLIGGPPRASSSPSTRAKARPPQPREGRPARHPHTGPGAEGGGG